MTNEYSWALTTQPSYLAHYGTKGMKWGDRKYQYNDGSLTPAGRERYYSKLHGNNTVGSRLKTAFTGKYADGTESYTHYRNRAAKAAKGRIDADSDYVGPIGSYLGERRAAKYGKGMSSNTINAGKQIYKSNRNAEFATGIGAYLSNAGSTKIGDIVTNATGDSSYGAAARIISSYSGSTITQALVKEKILGSQKTRSADATIAKAYEKSTARK